MAAKVCSLGYRVLVGRDDVGAVLQAGFEVLNGRLAGVRVHGGQLKQHVGARGFKPLAHAGGGEWHAVRHLAAQDGLHIQAVGIGQPAQPTSGGAGEPVFDAVSLAQLRRFSVQEPNERAAHIAEAQDGQKISLHGAWVRGETE